MSSIRCHIPFSKYFYTPILVSRTQTSNLSAGTTATITATTTRAHNIGTINDYGASGYGAQCGWNGTHQSIVRKFQPAKFRQISQCGRNGTSELIAIQTQLPKFSYISQC